jgi:hypothetical protein
MTKAMAETTTKRPAGSRLSKTTVDINPIRQPAYPPGARIPISICQDVGRDVKRYLIVRPPATPPITPIVTNTTRIVAIRFL